MSVKHYIMSNSIKSPSSVNGWRLELKSHSDNCRTYTFIRERKTLTSIFLSLKLPLLLVAIVLSTLGLLKVDFQLLPLTQLLMLHVALLLPAGVCMRLYQGYHVYKESLLVVGTYGIQVSETYSTGTSSNSFYSVEHIHSLIINEGVSMCSIFFYMAVVLKSGDELTKLHPLFTNSKPRLVLLRLLYSDMNEFLSLPSTSKNSS